MSSGVRCQMARSSRRHLREVKGISVPNRPVRLYDIGVDAFTVLERAYRAESEARRLCFFLEGDLGLWLHGQVDRAEALAWLESQPWAVRGILIPPGVLENLRER